MPEDRSQRPVVRVTKADGSHVNVRKDELEKYLADNAGAIVEDQPGEGADEVIEEKEAPAARRAAR